ncbi:MAG: hypothetical protein FGM15_00185 [Chthoniobacterales bacterium]|nr:hypothetical protein [Chthoniobacterales bacterium]
MRITAFLVLPALAALLGLAGCQTTGSTSAKPDPRAAAMIAAEKPGAYYIGRRYYKKDYKMWGWVRRPGQPWNTAQLVMMNENTKLAPDRAQGVLGIDNNTEYRLQGRFTGGKVYEPASNDFYPEFVLTGYEVVSNAPPMIYPDRRALDPAVRILAPPR